MADTYTVKNKKQGFLGKLGNSFASIPLGIIIIIFGCGLIWNNEKKNVINIKDVKELRETVKKVSSESVDSAYEGKPIVTSGKLDFGNTYLTDSTFGISELTPILVRTVEMYAWTETSQTKDDETTYTYSTEWTTKPEQSANFKQSEGHTNPSQMPFENQTLKAESLKVGAFELSNSFKDKLTTNASINALEPGVALPEGYAVNGKYITNSANLESPAVGDVRISFGYGDYTDVTVLGKQEGSKITGFVTAKGSTIIKLSTRADATPAELIDEIEAGNKFSKWLWRIFGLILVCMGTSMVLSPLTTLIGVIPFLGKIVNGALGVVSFAIGFAISLVVMGIAWLVYRPILGIALIVVSVGSIVLAKMYLSKKKDNNPSEVKEEIKEENKEEN